jgi:hexokinase
VVVEILRDMAALGLIPRSAALDRGGVLGGAALNGILSDGPELEDCALIAARDLGLPGLDYERRRALKAVAEAVTARSARLVGATFAGTVTRIDPGLERPHVVAIDGSLYELMPGYDGHIRASLDEILGSGAGKVTTVLAKDGSGLGAAIAAAVATGRD